MSVVSVVITFENGEQVTCIPEQVKPSQVAKRKPRTSAKSTAKTDEAKPKSSRSTKEPNTEDIEEEQDHAQAVEAADSDVPMNHEPKVQLNWSRGRTRKHRSTHVAVFGTGFWYIGEVEGESRLFFKHVTGSEEQHECDPQLSVGRAKVCATKISQRLVEEAVANTIDQNNAIRMAEAFIEHVGESITVGEATYRFRAKRTRREVNAAVVTYVAAGDRRLEIRMWNRAGTPFDEAMEVWITEYIEKRSMIGWFKQRMPFKELATLRAPTLSAPPFHRLQWTKKGKKMWSTTYDERELEVVEGPNTSQLQLRNDGKYKRLGEVIPLQCGPTDELRDHALTFLRNFENARARKPSKKANESDEATETEDIASKPTKKSEPKQTKTASKSTPKPAAKQPAKDKPAEQSTDSKAAEVAEAKPKEAKPKKTRTRRKKTTKKATKKTTRKTAEKPPEPVKIEDDDDDGATVDVGNVNVEKLLEKAGDIANQIELPVMGK